MSTSARRRILLSVSGYRSNVWEELLSGEFDVVREPDRADDPTIEYAIVWKHPHGVLAQLPNLKAILSLGAGVDHILTDPNLPDIPIARVVAQNLTQHMQEYIAWRVLDHHRQGATYRAQQAVSTWEELSQPTASDVTVGIMGLGQLGTAVAQTLKSLGFGLNSWTRTPKQLAGIDGFHGQDGLAPFLAATDILVALLPHTPATEGIVDYELLRGLRRDNRIGGAVFINGGRGMLQNEADILRALDDGTLKEASIDVFRTEPLPLDSPLWTHPRVFITPHAAATSDPVHLAPLMLEQIARVERGERMQHEVNRDAGY